MNEIHLPELGEDIGKATIACWHKKIGERVVADDDICEVVTDKATFNVSSGVDGILKEIRFKAGEEASIGDVLALVAPAKES